MTHFTNELFALAYPAGWVDLEHQDNSGLLLANSYRSLERYRQGAAFESGDQALCISLTPAGLFQPLFIPIEPGASAEALSESVLTRLNETNGTEAGALKVMILEDGREVAARKATREGMEGAVALFEIAEGITALCTMAAFPGEYQAAEASALAILASLEFSGTAAALTDAIDPAPPMEGPVR